MQLRSLLTSIALTAILAGLAAPASAATVPAAVMAPISAVLKYTNANDTSKLDAYYTSDAVVIDEFAPYVWTGSSAGARWWTSLMAVNRKTSISNMKASMQPVQHFNVSGDKAYVVVPATVSFFYKGKPQKETGTLTMTLQRSGTDWKIATQTWGTLSNTMM
jgi:ketosteroid isomerase-like protein